MNREGLDGHKTAAGLAHELCKRMHHGASRGRDYAAGKGNDALRLHAGENACAAYFYAALGEQVAVCNDKVLCLADVIKPRPAGYRRAASDKALYRNEKRHGEGYEHGNGRCAHENAGENVSKG